VLVLGNDEFPLARHGFSAKLTTSRYLKNQKFPKLKGKRQMRLFYLLDTHLYTNTFPFPVGL
jgi:hypothetical protein